MNGTKLTGAFAATVLLLAGCSAGTGQPDGPEAVVEAFNRAITAGDFSTACSLCDTASMKDYLESYREAWDAIMEEDSTALAIASGILSGSVLEITSVEKDGKDKCVKYRLEADGRRKERVATVRQEEGEWKVAAITDAI